MLFITFLLAILQIQQRVQPKHLSLSEKKAKESIIKLFYFYLPCFFFSFFVLFFFDTTICYFLNRSSPEIFQYSINKMKNSSYL